VLAAELSLATLASATIAAKAAFVGKLSIKESNRKLPSARFN
jgi:hypothetical protein